MTPAGAVTSVPVTGTVTEVGVLGTSSTSTTTYPVTIALRQGTTALPSLTVEIVVSP